MATVERTIAIRRPVDQVYRFLADPRTATQWRIEPVDVEYEVLALEPGRRIALRTVGTLRAAGEFELEGMGEATILTCRLTLSVPWWQRWLKGPRVRAALERELRSLDDLQDLLER